MDVPQSLQGLDLTTLVEQPIAEATAAVEQAGGAVRAIAPGGIVTADYRPDRVTLVVVDGRVAESLGIG
ncbi:MAG: I78 family peptidase inhibitor [Jatrophihabitantaceae bacterium]